MNLTEKWQEITLMNSKCSENTVDTHSQLYRAIIKNLKEDKCHLHQQKYEYYYHNRLLCPECFTKALEEGKKFISPLVKKQYETFYHLESILNHPIILVIDEEELFSHAHELMQLTLKSYKPLYPKKSDLKIQRQCIESFITRIKTRINQLCDTILTNFKEMESSISRQSELRQQLKDLGMMYETQLMEMLGENFVEGSKQELQRILQDYSNCNQNPMPKILVNLEDLMTTLGSSPFFNTQILADIYTTVTDDRVWKLDRIISSLDQLSHQKETNADMIVDFDSIKLQGQYILSIRENEAILQVDSKIIGRLEVQVDSLYHLSNYRLLGVNYDKVMIINYFDHLQVEKQYELTGCTDILPFKDYIVAISNENLIKIDRNTSKWQLIGKYYKNLRYSSGSDIVFSCQDQSDQTVNWSQQIKFAPISSSN